jgi:small subunit ribosomal protein S17
MADNPATTGHRNSKVGQVVSRSGNKTIVVKVTRRVQDPLYQRYVNKSKKFYAHDEQNQSLPGDRVRIVETRPMSKLKRWRLVQIVHRRSRVASLPAEAELAEPLAVPPAEPAPVAEVAP